MEKFNNTSLFTGYLKQLLNSFNLPKYRVYTRENLKYYKENGVESPEIIESILADKWVDSSNKDFYTKDTRYINYIKNNKIQRYVNGKWLDTPWHYHYNKKELNQTKNLVVKNNTYDSYTHEYLGEYLRFQRDYNNLDLMPLYNCFSNVICQHLDFSDREYGGLNSFKISTDLSYNYKIYMLPVKLFKSYTIAIDCSSPIEICCGFYTKYQDTREKLKRMPMYTYEKINNSLFGQPFIYDNLSYNKLSSIISGDDPAQDPATAFISNIAEFAQYEDELKMFIKIPIENNSTITILEGDYSGYNQGILLGKSKDKKWYTAINHFVTNYESVSIGEKEVISPGLLGANPNSNYKEIVLPSINERDFTPYTYLQLLLANTKESYPFADRLVEYLIGNVITENDDIMDNIVRAQKTMEINGWSFNVDGTWEPKMRNIAYDYFTSTVNDFNTSGITFIDKLDCLGYIDKSVEKYYTGWRKEFKLDKDGNRIKTGETEPEYTILNTSNPIQTLTEEKLRILQADETPKTVDVYETVYTQVSSISNMDIYPDIYKDDKKGEK